VMTDDDIKAGSGHAVRGGQDNVGGDKRAAAELKAVGCKSYGVGVTTTNCLSIRESK
jgi:hypothetical protein